MSDFRKIQPVPLTAEAFKPFGEVIEASESREHFTINSGFTERFHSLAEVETLGENARAAISIFRSSPLAPDEDGFIKMSTMERHPLGSQAFMPLGDEPYLVLVAPGGEFNEDKLCAFLAQPNQGVNYAAGTWHHFCLALNRTSDFLVVDRIGDGNNCDEVALDTPVRIAVNVELSR
jgi:ureidoglycolate lyase